MKNPLVIKIVRKDRSGTLLAKINHTQKRTNYLNCSSKKWEVVGAKGPKLCSCLIHHILSLSLSLSVKNRKREKISVTFLPRRDYCNTLSTPKQDSILSIYEKLTYYFLKCLKCRLIYHITTTIRVFIVAT